MSALFHLSCFYNSSSASYKGGSDGVPRWGQLTNLLTALTVSTRDQFIPNRAWTLINLSPPTALKIQFKGPVTDQNELAFFPRPQWLTCSELAVWSCSSWICQFVCALALPFISVLLHFLVKIILFLRCLFHLTRWFDQKTNFGLSI